MSVEIICTECNGDGTITEMFAGCNNPSSANCCGGCSETRNCEYCCGSGYMEIDLWQYINNSEKTGKEIFTFLLNSVDIELFRDFLNELKYNK